MHSLRQMWTIGLLVTLSGCGQHRSAVSDSTPLATATERELDSFCREVSDAWEAAIHECHSDVQIATFSGYDYPLQGSCGVLRANSCMAGEVRACISAAEAQKCGDGTEKSWNIEHSCVGNCRSWREAKAGLGSR